MQIATILSNKGDSVVTVTPSSTVTSLLATLAEHQIGAAVVSQDGESISGIVSERDIVRAFAKIGASLLDAPVSQIMTKVVAVCQPKSTVEELMVVMTEQRVRHIPVADDDGNLIGIVSIGDVVKARMDSLEDERKSLIAYVTS